jgi:hypothetical protein
MSHVIYLEWVRSFCNEGYNSLHSDWREKNIPQTCLKVVLKSVAHCSLGQAQRNPGAEEVMAWYKENADVMLDH